MSTPTSLTDAQVRELIELLVDWRAVGTTASLKEGHLQPSELKMLRAVKAKTDGTFARLDLLKMLFETG